MERVARLRPNPTPELDARYEAAREQYARERAARAAALVAAHPDQGQQR